MPSAKFLGRKSLRGSTITIMSTGLSLMDFAEVEYSGGVYHDAEMIGGSWDFYNAVGAFSPFHAQ
jgi:hypothetical protein